MSEKKFARGFYGTMKPQNAPSFVLGRVSIKVEDAIQWLQENKNEKGYVNLDIYEGRDNKLSIFLNEFKPKSQPIELNDSLPF
jgi:predicted membrane-bound spermidine synthase